MIGVSACLQLLIITTIFSPFSHTALILGGMIAYRRFSFYVDSVNMDSFYNIIGVSATMGDHWEDLCQRRMPENWVFYVVKSRGLSRLRIELFRKVLALAPLDLKFQGSSELALYWFSRAQNITTVYSEFWSNFLSLTRIQILQKERTPCSCKPNKKITWSSLNISWHFPAKNGWHFVSAKR